MNQSPRFKLSEQDILAWVMNLVYFTAPAFAVFFGQLALGVEVKKAGLVALLAFYGALADLFKKWSRGPQ